MQGMAQEVDRDVDRRSASRPPQIEYARRLLAIAG
jgi:hypothetical protein